MKKILCIFLCLLFCLFGCNKTPGVQSSNSSSGQNVNNAEAKLVLVYQTISQFNVYITLEKIEYKQDGTRVFLKIENHGEETITIYKSFAKISINGKLYSCEYDQDSNYEKINDTVYSGYFTEGWILFPKVSIDNTSVILEISIENVEKLVLLRPFEFKMSKKEMESTVKTAFIGGIGIASYNLDDNYQLKSYSWLFDTSSNVPAVTGKFEGLPSGEKISFKWETIENTTNLSTQFGEGTESIWNEGEEIVVLEEYSPYFNTLGVSYLYETEARLVISVVSTGEILAIYYFWGY